MINSTARPGRFRARDRTIGKGCPGDGRSAAPRAQTPREQDPPTEALPAAATPTPVLVASGLGVQGNAGWIFRDVDLRLPAGSLTAVVGPAGCGRSSLLLALAGRMRPTAGSLSVLGHNLAD